MRTFTRRTLFAAPIALASRRAQAESLFDGRTLDGWIQIENSATQLSTTAITDPAAFTAHLSSGQDAIDIFLRKSLQSDPKSAPLNAIVKELNQLLAGPSIYEKSRFTGVILRPETARLLAQNPTEPQPLERLNKLLLEDAYPRELAKSVTEGWTVKDGAMSSTGSGRGVIYTAKDYGRFRLTFTMRHVSGNPDHQAAVLIFCTRPQPNEKPLDALAGIQFQVPNGGHWDYRPGKNNNGGAEFTTVTKTHFDPHAWSKVEIEAEAATGRASMKVSQPPESDPVEVLKFADPTAGRSGPIAWQMHNAGLLDEFKQVSIA